MESTNDLLSQGWFQYYWYEKADPRTKDWTVFSSPWVMPSIILSYLYFVLYYGPRFMKNRPPYSLTTFIKCYNLSQIITNAILVHGLVNTGWLMQHPSSCASFSYNFDPNSQKLAELIYWTAVVKLIDLIETVVFVLRKKNNQISFLHLYHHVSTAIIGWLVVKYMAVEVWSFPIIVNCSVHVIMYTYYLLSTFKGQIKMYMMKVKPALTIIQMVQFVVLILYALQGLTSRCALPMPVCILFHFNLIANFILFYNFYKQNYGKRPKKM